jgi:hypothetical protein
LRNISLTKNYFEVISKQTLILIQKNKLNIYY